MTAYAQHYRDQMVYALKVLPLAPSRNQVDQFVHAAQNHLTTGSPYRDGTDTEVSPVFPDLAFDPPAPTTIKHNNLRQNLDAFEAAAARLGREVNYGTDLATGRCLFPHIDGLNPMGSPFGFSWHALTTYAPEDFQLILDLSLKDVRPKDTKS